MATQYKVKGEWATKNEYFVSVALDILKIPYSFHVDVWGGSRLRGGYVIDFVVETPFYIPLEVFGDYWHTGTMSAGDRLKIDNLRFLFGHEPIILWGSETDTQEKALESVRKKVR